MRAATVQEAMAPIADDCERRWVERARAGDEDAFRMLMERHRDRGYAIALRITRSPDDAEDVVQQAFVRVWFSLEKFRGESSFGTWLHRIVARCAFDRASQIKTRSAREIDLDDSLPSASADARDVILIRRFDALMKELSTAQRAVVTLHYWSDTPVEEVARVLNMPENTVKTHLSRARAALREAWLRREGSR
jgi:RNA polymerase sigma-70 factor (ECF subfamily)